MITVDFRDGAGRWWRRDGSGALIDMAAFYELQEDTVGSWLPWQGSERETARNELRRLDATLAKMDRTSAPTAVLVRRTQKDAEDCTDS